MKKHGKHSTGLVRFTLSCSVAALVVACQEHPLAVDNEKSITSAPPAVRMSHSTPTLPLTNTIVGNLDQCKASGGTAIGASVPKDRKVGGSGNRFRTGNGSWTAIWANADHDPKENTLEVPGSWNVVNGNSVSRSHLRISGSDNVFFHSTEYGQRSASGKEAFDLSGANNCFTPEPAQVFRNAPPAAPAGFPFSSVFDPNSNGNILEHFAPSTALAIAYTGSGQYFACINGTVNTIPAPLVCSSGKISGSVQGSQMPTGLYYASGEVDISASNLTATVTIVAGGKFKVSGSTQTQFRPFHNRLLFATHHIRANGGAGSANTDLAEDAMEVSGSSSFFRGLIVATNGRTKLSGSQNSFTCPVMGDRVSLSGQNLYVSGEECPTANLRVSLTPLAATNRVGDPHTVTATVETDATGTWQVVQGATVTFSLLNNTASAAFVPPGANSCTTGAAGTCSIQINTPTPGSVDIQATANATVNGFPLSATSGSAGNIALGGSANANKIYVDLRIRLSPLTATNAVGAPHEITATVEENLGLGGGWVGVGAGETVSFSLLNNTAGAAFTPAATTTCVTVAASTCSVSINSSAPGSVDIQGSTTVAVSGLSITRTTGTAQNTTAGGTGNVNKVYVDLRISLSPLNATNAFPDPHVVTALVEKNEGLGGGWVGVGSGATVNFALLNNVANAVFVGAVSSCLTSAASECSITITPGNNGAVTIQGSTIVSVSGQSITRTTGTAANTTAGGSGNASKNWIGGSTFLIIDEDGIDNGLRFVENPTLGIQNIFPSTLRVFDDEEVNDDVAAIGMRDVLRYFADADNIGKNVAMLTGQTGDEAWFAPNCIPNSWTSAGSGCATTGSAAFLNGIGNFFDGTINQSLLDQIPDVRPLRALGLKEKVGELICAVVYDSDISINYGSSPPYLLGNLQGSTLGVVAFTVLHAVKLNGFSGSSLPEMHVRIEDASNCSPTRLNDAPIPGSSSEPADVDPASPPSSGYRNR